MADILLAEDDADIAEVVTEVLTTESHAVRVAKDGVAALAAYAEKRPDLMLLDVMMPLKNGFVVCAEIRAHDSSLPILFLTAKADEVDKVRGLGLGADDYLTKPFGLQELVARVGALLRRAKLSESAAPEAVPARIASFTVGKHRVDTAKFEIVSPRGGRASVTRRELELLHFLVSHPGRVFTREELISSVWGYTFGETTRVVDMTILHLRKLLGVDGSHLETCYGSGYRYMA